jgi:hypothetical protein
MEAALGICRRPLKTFQQPKQSDKGPRWVKDKAVFWCKHCNTDFSVVVRKVFTFSAITPDAFFTVELFIRVWHSTYACIASNQDPMRQARC